MIKVHFYDIVWCRIENEKNPLYFGIYKKVKGDRLKEELTLPYQSQRKSNSKKLLKIYNEKMNYYVPIQREVKHMRDSKFVNYIKFCFTCFWYMLYIFSIYLYSSFFNSIFNSIFLYIFDTLYFILKRKFALTPTAYKYLDIGISMRFMSNVKIVIGDNRGNRIILSHMTMESVHQESSCKCWSISAANCFLLSNEI